jgi:hypothetical protein
VEIGRILWVALLAGVVAVTLTRSNASAAQVPVVNPSFESPATPFADPSATGWTLGGPPEILLAGVFNNNSTSPGDLTHYTNQDGDQLAFVGTGSEFSQVLATNFQAGQKYTLGVGVGVSPAFGLPLATDALRLALFYTDDAGDRHLVASKDVFNNTENALSTNLLKFFETETPLLAAGDPAVGRPIGVLLAGAGQPVTIFDMDAVTLTTVPEPGVLGVVAAAGALLTGGRRRRA